MYVFMYYFMLSCLILTEVCYLFNVVFLILLSPYLLHNVWICSRTILLQCVCKTVCTYNVQFDHNYNQ